MKFQAIAVLLALVIGIMAPPLVPYQPLAARESQIGTLDVCHSAIPALSSQGEMPVLTTPCACITQTADAITFAVIDPQLLSSLTSFPEERPPKI